MEKLLAFLNSVNPLSEALNHYLSLHLKTRELGKKEFLLKAGHVCRAICFVEDGLLRCFYKKGDVEVCSWFMKEGDVIVSIESFFQQKPSYESIQAVEDSTVHYIEYAELMFNITGRIVIEKYYQLWARQLYALRMNQAPERYNWLLENHNELILRVPAKYLASYLGITEGTLSTIKGAH
jgi:CRP-like cAMP-binding protein